mgnify:FL=1
MLDWSCICDLFTVSAWYKLRTLVCKCNVVWCTNICLPEAIQKKTICFELLFGIFSQDLKFLTKCVLSFMIKVIVSRVTRIKWCGVLRQNREMSKLFMMTSSDRHMSDGEILSIKMLSSGTMCWLYLCIYFLGCHSRVKRFDVLSAWTTIRALSSLPPFNEPVKCLYYFTVNFLAELSAIKVDCSAVCWVVSWVLTSELDGDTTWGLCTGLKWL